MQESSAVVERRRSTQRQALAELVEGIEAACAGPADNLREPMLAALASAALAPRLLTATQRRGGPDHYTRHLLHGDARGRFAIVSIVWLPGQCTPVHDHSTWCGYAVVEGSLQENGYLWMAACSAVRSSGSAERPAGYASFGHAGVEGVHRLGNRSTEPAISVHVYGVDAPRIATHVNRVLVTRD